ncbi:hypothetical protein NQ314_005505 [Rhamnusium bicolor]|uniref:Uncharacterized protein n=1 Tax=Rhamnusium bicolor TaxID=1586634 RepID=A0AAV8ZGM5_9CUCU|nr:hypothetical protein NQ314_005505 [Rhamnusium bicolor]
MVLNGEDLEKKRELESIVEEPEQNIRQEGFKKLFKEVRKRLDEATKKNERTYNLRRRHEEFLPNQMVWKRNFVLSDAAKYYTSKLAPKYIGPFYIKKRISTWTYELRDSAGTSKGIWNIKDLKSASAVETVTLCRVSSPLDLTSSDMSATLPSLLSALPLTKGASVEFSCTSFSLSDAVSDTASSLAPVGKGK